MTLGSSTRRQSWGQERYLPPLRHGLLTRKREQELARRVIEGEAMLVGAALETSSGRAALRRLAGDVRSGAKALRDVVRSPSDDDRDQRARLADFWDSLERRAAAGDDLARDLADLRLRRDLLAAIAAEGEPSSVARARRIVEDARRELVERNLRLVFAYARRYRDRGLPFLDLVQEGNLGLMHAVDKFDYRRGLRLTTYATWWIKQHIEGALDDTAAIIRVPAYLLEKKRSMLRIARRRRKADGAGVTIAELADTDGFTKTVVDRVMSAPLEPVSLEAPIADADQRRLLDVMTADVETPDDAVERRELGDRALAMLDTLGGRERQVLELRFGIGGAPERSCKEIGAELAITGQRVHQIERRALEKLRARAGVTSGVDAAQRLRRGCIPCAFAAMTP